MPVEYIFVYCLFLRLIKKCVSFTDFAKVIIPYVGCESPPPLCKDILIIARGLYLKCIVAKK